MKIEIIFFLIFLLLWFFVFCGLNKLIKKLSYSIDKRYLHFRFVVAGLLFSLVAANTYVSQLLIFVVDKVINAKALQPIIAKLLPNRSHSLIYMTLLVLGLNLIYAVGYIVVLIVTKGIFSRKQKFIEYEHCIGSERLVHLPWYFVNRFYKQENERFGLTSKGFLIGLWVKFMKYAFAIMFVLEFALLYWSILWGKEDWNKMVLSISKSAYLLPMLAFLVIEQIQFFLEGPEDYDAGTFGSADIDEQMIGDMDAMLLRYRETFAESGVLLCSEKGTESGIERQGLGSNDVGNQQLEDCREPRILEAISNQLRESEIRQNSNYQNALVSLINGDCVTIRDNPDGEFTVFLCAYLNHYLSQGKAAIVLCENDSDVAVLQSAFKKSVNKIKGIKNLWSIKNVSELVSTKHANILICTFEQLLNLDIINQYKNLAMDMFCAIIPDANSLMTYDNIRIQRVFSRLRSLRNVKQYVFIYSEDNDSLRTKIMLYLPQGIRSIPFSHDTRVPHTGIMVWKEESVYKPQLTLKIGSETSPYMGTALPLALVAAKYDLPQVNIVPCDSRGDTYFFGGALQSNLQNVSNYLENELNLPSVIRYSSSEAMDSQDFKSIIVYDTDFNFYNALWRWFKYAGNKGTLIHVVSPFYMMREYFAANYLRKSMLYSNNEFMALLPNETVLKRSRLAAILASIADVGMTEEELLGISRKYGWNYTDISGLLKDAILTVRPDNEFFNIYEHFKLVEEKIFCDNPSEFVYQIRIHLMDGAIKEQQHRQISMARMSFKDNEFITLPILSGNITNYYLPDQIAAIGGSLYRVVAIDDKNGILHTKPTHPQSIPDYYTVSNFELSNYKLIDSCIDSSYLDFNICEADVKRFIYGYISTTNGNDFSNVRDVSKINGGRNNMAVFKTHVPILEIEINKESFVAIDGNSEEDVSKATLLLTVLLNGMFKTLFPATYQNIIAVPDFPIDMSLIEKVTHAASVEEMIMSTVSRVEVKPDRDGRYIRIYIIEFSCIEYGMIEALYRERNEVLNKIYEYLSWYIASNQAAPGGDEDGGKPDGFIRGRYLHFGSDKMPTVFAPEALHSFLRKVLSRNEPLPVIEPDPVEYSEQINDSKSVCSFCNREIVFAWQMSDGRCMCAHCHDHQKTQKNDIYKLFHDTKDMLEDNYHISFKKNINVGFQSAEAIRKAAKIKGSKRIVGFYNSDKRQLWIEARGPSIAMESTIIHELTHAWQNDNLPIRVLKKSLNKLKASKRLELLLEGHAVYIEIEAMSKHGEVEYAERLKNSYIASKDVYGLGYVLIDEYIKSKRTLGSSLNSMQIMEELVDEIINKKENITWPKGY